MTLYLKPYQILYSDRSKEYIRNVDAVEIIGKFKKIDFKHDLKNFGNMPTSQEIYDILNTRKDKNDIWVRYIGLIQHFDTIDGTWIHNVEKDTCLKIRLSVLNLEIISASLIFCRGVYGYFIRELSYHTDQNAYS